MSCRVVLLAVGVALSATNCDLGPNEHIATKSGNVEVGEGSPSPDWVPGEDWIGPAPIPVVRTEAYFQAQAAAAKAEQDAWRSPAAWASRIRVAMPSQTSVAIVSLESTRSDVDSGRTFSVLLRVDELLSGQPLPSQIELLQAADEPTLPNRCHGFEPSDGARYAVVVSPDRYHPGAYSLLMDFDSLTFGWARETPTGQFATDHGQTIIERSVLEELAP